MAGAKIVVLYPAPRDPTAFERAYREEHSPMVTPTAFPGLTLTACTVLDVLHPPRDDYGDGHSSTNAFSR